MSKRIKLLLTTLVLLVLALTHQLLKNEVSTYLMITEAHYDSVRGGFVVTTRVNDFNPWEVRGREIFVPLEKLSSVDGIGLYTGEYFSHRGGVIAQVRLKGSLWLLGPLVAQSFQIDPGWEKIPKSSPRSFLV